MKITAIFNCGSMALAVLLVTEVVPALGQGTLIIQHSGATDPLTEGWSGSGGYPITNDLGVNAWSMPEPNNLGDHYQYDTTSQEQAELLSAGWIFSINARVATSNAPLGQFGYFDAVLWGSPASIAVLIFGSTTNGDPIVKLKCGSASDTITLTGAGSTYNLYQLQYDVTADTASLWIDGVDYLSNIALTNQNIVTVAWEGGGSPAYERVNWNLVSLEITPEPSTMALFGLGALIVATRCFRGRH
jgi:hypothetical protein